MPVVVHLPDELEKQLRAQTPNLDAQAKEAMLIELYRQDKLTHHQLAQALGLHRLELESLLKRHNVTEDLPTESEYNAALSRLGVTHKT